ncbi:MAG: M55 family metallopeptidase [Victivallaceae bacterium]|nr:M55 family metallopeptidase [Victivallaceae bacterium]
MKIFIITDLEGVSGINGRKADEVGNKIINTDAACRLLTEEVNAVVEGLLEAGADEIHILDGHGGSNSIQIENLHPAAELFISGGDLAPVTYIDSSYDAALQIGAHAMMGTGNGVMHHTFNSHGVVNMWLNGELIGEIGIEGLQCAYFGVPTILVSGDLAACHEAKAFFGKIETVETKTGISRYTVRNYNPVRVRQKLKEGAKKALLAKSDFPVKNLNGPYEIKVQLMCPNMADNYEKAGAERLDQSTILLKSDDFLDVWAQRNGWAPGVHNKKFNIINGNSNE